MCFDGFKERRQVYCKVSAVSERVRATDYYNGGYGWSTDRQLETLTDIGKQMNRQAGGLCASRVCMNKCK